MDDACKSNLSRRFSVLEVIKVACVCFVTVVHIDRAAEGFKAISPSPTGAVKVCQLTLHTRLQHKHGCLKCNVVSCLN